MRGGERFENGVVQGRAYSSQQPSIAANTPHTVILDIRVRSLFKWQFDVFENDSLVADIDLKIWKEGADIEIKGEPFRIYRDGMFRGPYVLEAHRTELIRAEKTPVFKRRFEVI